MAPITLFDKSFLQSLSLDESVWFDHYFLTNVCPLFYVETLADLNKSVRDGRTPQQEVGIIADKFPEMRSAPNVQHVTACTGELLGHRVPMTGQILLAGGRPVRANGQTGIVFEERPEAAAFSRWQKHEFLKIEELYAQGWRETVTNLDLKEVANLFRSLGINGKTCKTVEEAKELAERIVAATDKPFDQMHLALLFLNIHPRYHQEIMERWKISNYPALPRYAPYVAYVYTIELFFQIALAANLISSDRPSNRVDIGYLFYLPFSMVFVSSDKLHRKCAPLFLRENQQFIWGLDLKNGLNEINQYYSAYPEDEKEKGVMSFASDPPKEGNFLISQIWDRHFPSWRNRKNVDLSDKNIKHDKIAAHVKKFDEAPTLQPTEVDFDVTDTDSITVKKVVRKMKGSWYQVPKDVKLDK